MTIGIVGYGKIGAAIAQRVVPFGSKVIAIVGRPSPPKLTPPGLSRLDGSGGLAELLEESDVVILACPLNDRTNGLIAAAQLACMKPSAILINIARGAVVDEAALFSALQEGSIGGAAIDVWWRLPDVANGHLECAPYDLMRHPFHTLPNVLMSPHTSGWSDEQHTRRQDVMAANLDALLTGKPLTNVIVSAAA